LVRRGVGIMGGWSIGRLGDSLFFLLWFFSFDFCLFLCVLGVSYDAEGGGRDVTGIPFLFFLLAAFVTCLSPKLSTSRFYYEKFRVHGLCLRKILYQ
jgi:hypothetical protein